MCVRARVFLSLSLSPSSVIEPVDSLHESWYERFAV
jgi:hypothetical protein